MNKIPLFFVIIMISHTIYLSAQMTIRSNFIDDYSALDSSKLIVRYSLDFISNPDKPKDVQADIVVLEIGHHLSKSYSYGLFKHDSILTNSRANSVPQLQVPVPPMEVFKNYPSGKNSVVHRSPLRRLIFLYEDDIDIEWKIFPERRQISGHTCQRAIATFRGRTWEAWFTNQIPVSDGPWKFHGLPGLILQVTDDQNHYSFTCIGLSRDIVPIKKWNWKYERTSRENTNDYMRRYAERPVESMRQMGVTLYMPGRSQEEMENYSYPYNPLELE
ncbi:MAG: GLPGLI family protein [Bacteroidota bacterium]